MWVQKWPIMIFSKIVLRPPGVLKQVACSCFPYPPAPSYPFFLGGGFKTSLRIVAAVCVFGPGS